MANLMDYSAALVSEGNLAKDYEKFEKESVNNEVKENLKELKKLTLKKMRILHNIIKEGPWLLDEDELDE